MGAHSTFQDALAGVTAFNAGQGAADQRPAQQSNGRAAEQHHGKKKTHKKGHAAHTKEKKEKKEKKDKKDKSSKRKKVSRRREAGGNSGSDASDDSGPENLEQQLERGRIAVRTTRDILAQLPGLKHELRELLWRVDQGGAVGVAGIPDAALRERLEQLLAALGLRRTSQGIFVRRHPGASALALLGPILEEEPAAPSAPAPTRVPAADPDPDPVRLPGGAVSGVQASDTRPAPALRGAPAPAASGSTAQEDGSDEAVEIDQLQDVAACARNAEPVTAGIGPFSPSLGPESPAKLASFPEEEHSEAVAVGSATGAAHVQGASVDGDEIYPAAAHPARPIAGPAAPPPELLAAAAEAMAWEAAQGAEDDDGGELVGPPPPDITAEAEGASGDARTAEVLRIVSVLDAAATTQQPDAYQLLGLDSGAAPGEVKRRYWRLSLTIHPDKCGHPAAARAFDAVARAAKDLQDTGARGRIDAAREEAALRAAFAAEAAAAERARQWRLARGTATAEDRTGPAAGAVGPAQREDWMTQLPELRRPGARPLQKNVTAFSQRGPREAGDAAAWAETPAQRLLRLSGGPAAPALAAPSAADASNAAVAAAAAALVDAYNAAQRGQTLVEQHATKAKTDRKRRRQAAGAGAAAGQGAAAVDQGPGQKAEAWEGAHPWRPFNRETDLEMGPKRVSKEEVMKKAGSLAGRFAGGDAPGQRTFL